MGAAELSSRGLRLGRRTRSLTGRLLKNSQPGGGAASGSLLAADRWPTFKLFNTRPATQCEAGNALCAGLADSVKRAGRRRQLAEKWTAAGQAEGSLRGQCENQSALMRSLARLQGRARRPLRLMAFGFRSGLGSGTESGQSSRGAPSAGSWAAQRRPPGGNPSRTGERWVVNYLMAVTWALMPITAIAGG